MAVRYSAIFAIAMLLLTLGQSPARCANEDSSASGLGALIEVLAEIDEADVQLDLLRGMQSALLGRRNVPAPAGWSAVAKKLSASTSNEVRERTLALGLIFGDPQARDQLRMIIADEKSPLASREAAVRELIQNPDDKLEATLLKLLENPALRKMALQGLANVADPAIPQKILDLYPKLGAEEKSVAVLTLASRVESARLLMTAIEAGKIPHRDLSAFTVRQLQGLGDVGIVEAVNRFWGTSRPTSDEKKAQVTQFKTLLLSGKLGKPDLSKGRIVFSKTCASCHVLFDAGQKIGPELTGSQRANLDYVLENMVDPSAVVPRDYRIQIIETVEGRVITGIVTEETEFAITLLTPNGKTLLSKADIEQRTQSAASMMPEGMLTQLSETELRDLVGYLASPQQVPLPGP